MRKLASAAVGLALVVVAAGNARAEMHCAKRLDADGRIVGRDCVASAAMGAPAVTGPVTGLTVTDMNNGTTANGMAGALLGGGVTILNATYTGDNRAAGMFSGGTGIIGFESGIILDSGKVQTYPTDPPCGLRIAEAGGVEGPNTCHELPEGNANSTRFNTPGDTDLEALSGFPTFDASILEFDFVPAYSTLQLRYVFSSEEYSDYANTEFNDVFAFLVNGVNCAVVPRTDPPEPVSVNSINNGNDVGGDPTPHNADFFVDNVNPRPSLNTQMDGLTTVFACDSTVDAGQINHIKLAIADASDTVFDSAVFLQAGSLLSGTQISTSLASGGRSGATISVPPDTAVVDSAALLGVNAADATGTVTYSVYSDGLCQNAVASGGTKNVSGGVVASSNPVTLNALGTYYWQASYSGDASHNPATSACGQETEIVAVPTPTRTPAPVAPAPPVSPAGSILLAAVLLVTGCLFVYRGQAGR